MTACGATQRPARDSSRSALRSSTASARRREYRSKPTAAMWPGLLAAEDVAGAADLEVGQGDLEAGAELRGVEDRLEALAGLLAHPLAAAVEQVRVRAPRGAPDPAAELVELGEPERVRPVDDDRVRVRDVEAGLDDRRAHEDVRLAARRTSASRSRAGPRPSARGRRRGARPAAVAAAARPGPRSSRPGCGRRTPGRRDRARAGSRRAPARPTPRRPASGSAGGPPAASR